MPAATIETVSSAEQLSPQTGWEWQTPHTRSMGCILALPSERRSPTRQALKRAWKHAGSEIGAPPCQSNRGQQAAPHSMAASRCLWPTSTSIIILPAAPSAAGSDLTSRIAACYFIGSMTGRRAQHFSSMAAEGSVCVVVPAAESRTTTLGSDHAIRPMASCDGHAREHIRPVLLEWSSGRRMTDTAAPAQSFPAEHRRRLCTGRRDGLQPRNHCRRSASASDALAHPRSIAEL